MTLNPILMKRSNALRDRWHKADTRAVRDVLKQIAQGEIEAVALDPMGREFMSRIAALVSDELELRRDLTGIFGAYA